MAAKETGNDEDGNAQEVFRCCTDFQIHRRNPAQMKRRCSIEERSGRHEKLMFSRAVQRSTVARLRKVADAGRHLELMDRFEAYRKIWQFQDHDIPPTSPLSENESVLRSETRRHTPYNS